MYVVIAGAGLVGRGLAGALVRSRHDVVVVDHDNRPRTRRLFVQVMGVAETDR